ncbi:putative U3 small nucleolar RNA-associated protein [Tripterygium wilfordii]|uniref:Putative U3 small nucleolar RNA-associated protein n=1 Tax=Tripterygium wilfordii TaxID=458696 RepID=A0A7J7CBB8_TRIWF|nr:U3 small nucleolar RNA-associated protein 14 homolog A [Tripterygium wilfordii]KAF5731438.1 putative U3 small nucleolar RNA-associated protein [Tripterygium wilfordii]
MGENKRKAGRELAKRKMGKSNKRQKQHSDFKTLDKRKKKRLGGPRLPTGLRRELDRVNHTNSDGEDDEIVSDEEKDVYEYEEGVPEEESRKNRRFDPVENYEYELPEKFEDEDVPSDDDENDFGGGKNESSMVESDDAEEEDDERHVRMLQGITGMPNEVFLGKKKKRNIIVSEAYPESEYNPSGDILDGRGHISVEDLLDPLHGKSGYSQLRKRVHQMARKPMTIHAPLPKVVQEKLERKAVYEQTKKDITKWEPLVKRNREAPTIIFEKDVNLGFSTVGAIASEFEPRTDFEKKIAGLVYDEKVIEAHNEDGSRLLELNKVTVEDYRSQRNHIAKLRSLLFHHEMKKKRIKKIKSKTYHRLAKKDRLKATSAEMEMDPEAAKEQAMKQEFKRAEERMTLKHKNKSKWAKRILKRGIPTQDDGTRAAISEQLHQHTLLTRKMKSMKDGSSSSDGSSDDSSDEEDVDENLDSSNQDTKLLERAKEKTLKVLEEDDDEPNSGVLSLPFMVRGMKKRKEAAVEEAKLALKEYETSLNQLDDLDSSKDSKIGAAAGGRRVFGAAKHVPELSSKIEVDNDYSDSDRDDDLGGENVEVGNASINELPKEGVSNLYSLLHDRDLEMHQDSAVKFDNIVEPGPKVPGEVAIFASGKWKKIKSGSEVDTNVKRSSKVVEPVSRSENLEMKTTNVVDANVKQFPKVVEPVSQIENLKEVVDDSDTDSEGQMVDGILSSGMKATYEIPSQADLIRHAFAGDDVEEEFVKDKDDILNEENPEPEKPVLLPGWGQWTNIQKKKGLPSWMLKEHENAKKKREEVLKKRKDAHLKHVIISEKLDKKAEKLHTKALPYPFTSKEVFEQSIRMPIGPEFNPATAVGALTRPEVVKRPGVIIKPIKFEEVDSFEKTEDRKRNAPKRKTNKNKHRLKPVVAKS